MYVYTYKDLVDVSLTDIYDKYADKDSINLLQFRQRIYDDKMTMEEALTNPLSGRSLKLSEFNTYIDVLYSRLRNLNEHYVSRAHFLIKMGQGFAPEIAIVNKHPGRAKRKKPAPDRTKDIVKELKKQEQKEKKEEKRAKIKKARPFTKKEKVYVENLGILDSAFSKVKNKHCEIA